MPRYFFTIHGKDRVQNDPDGTYLPDAEAALSYADYTIRELRSHFQQFETSLQEIEALV